MPQEQTKQISAIESSQAGLLSIIDAMANNPAVDVEKLERMLALQERLMAHQAEIDFNEALTRVNDKMPRITKTKGVSYDGKKDAFKYAPLEKIDEIVKPLLKEEGFSVAYTVEPREGGGGVVIGTLTHVKGHKRVSSIPLPVDTSGGKNAIQGMGSTTMYGRRYVLCNLLDIVVIGADDDGMGGVIDDSQAANIKQLIKESEADTKGFLKYMGVQNVKEIMFKDYRKATSVLEEKKKKNAKAQEQPK